MILSAFLLFEGCRKTSAGTGNKDKEISPQELNSSSEINYSNVRYSSFQNPDSTWGFTIFVNSRPFLHYKKIPFNKAVSGFISKKDAESVAEIFLNMIKAGEQSPKLTRRAIDTLGLIIKNQ